MSKFKKINKKEYRELFKKVEFKTFFHNPEWHDFLEKEFKWIKFEYYLYGDKIIFPLANVACLLAGRRKLISLPFCEYGGPLPRYDININKFSTDALEEFKNIKIKIWPQISKISGNLQNASSTLLSHWLEGLENSTEEELLSSFRKTLRHSIRNAQKNNLEIKKCQNLAELKIFYNLYVANLKRKKTIPYPYSIFKFLFKRPETEILLAWHRGKIIAGDLFLHYDKFVHYFISASNFKYRKLSANPACRQAGYLLLWEKIKSLIGKDIIFDLGASPRDSKLEIFKRGWGGKECPIYQISLSAGRQGIKRTDEGLRSSKLRDFYGLLPNWLIKKLSSKLIKYRL